MPMRASVWNFDGSALMERPHLGKSTLGGSTSEPRCDEKTCDLRVAETMAYQIFDSTFARPFTRTSTIARLK